MKAAKFSMTAMLPDGYEAHSKTRYLALWFHDGAACIGVPWIERLEPFLFLFQRAKAELLKSANHTYHDNGHSKRMVVQLAEL